MSSSESQKFADIFPGESAMAQAMRRHDWASTPLGDPRGWPEALRIPLRMLLTTRFDMWIGWGDDLFFFYNDAYAPTLGIKHPAMLGRPFREVWSEVYDEVADQVELVRRGEATWNKALLLLLERSGEPEETYHSFSYSPLFAADGAVGGLLCIVTEETARVVGERRLDTVRQLGTALAGASDTATVRHAVDTVFAANRRDFPFVLLRFADEAPPTDELTRQLAGWMDGAPEQGSIVPIPGTFDWPTGAWDVPPREAIVIAVPVARTATSASLVLALNPYRPSGADMLDMARLIAGQIGGTLGTIAALTTERRRADRIWNVSRDLIVIVDADGRFRAVSPAWTGILGHPVDDAIGRRFNEFLHPDDLESSEGALARVLGNEELYQHESRFRAADGSYHPIEWQASLEDGLVYAYGRDMTERRRVEEALSDSEEQFRRLVQGVTDYAIYMIDLEGHVSSWNEGARRIKGYEPDEIMGEHFSRFYTEEDRARGEPNRTLETARREGRFVSEGWRVRKNGERFRASVVIDAIRDDEGRTIGFAKITRDVTERDAAQRELDAARETLFQSQKMEAIGQLTGGVAHDFNNLLMAVLGSLELLRKRLPDDALTLRLLDNAVEGAKRGATLTQRMLAFARRQDLKVDQVDIAQLLGGMNDLVQRSIGPEWPISMNFPLKLPPVRADANQLEMALLNLIVNARDAMPSGGPIVISATCEEVSGSARTDLPAGTYVRLVVADRGAGMDAETLRRATEPFFTTKGVGKGTGLGLPMVHGMAEQIGGRFELASRLGQGTSAILWLPMATDHAPAAEQPVETAHHSEVRRLRILAVDDDALVLINTVALLEDLGHSVVEADGAAEALEIFRADDDIDLIVTDQAMPNMTGIDLISAIDQIRAGTPVIIASGYGEGLAIEGRAVVHLAKPFNQAQLAAAVSAAVGTD